MTTKRLSIVLLGLFLVLTSFADNNDLAKDITMVSYEQSWRDSHGTLALKNNTTEEIQNVVFLITYLDMAGKELDYEEFFKRVDIAPGMTRKLDISAYEHGRHYHYYKSEGLYNNTSFRIKFKLKDYNVEEETTESTDAVLLDRFDYDRTFDSGNEGVYFIFCLVGLLLFVGIYAGFYVLVAVLAQKRNRNVVIWILLSLLATPLLMIIILLCIGKDESNTLEQHYER